MLLFVLLFGFFSVAQPAPQPDSNQVLGIVGESLRFPVEIPDLLPDEEINWKYGREYPSWTLVRIRNGKIEDNYLERFKTRLQVDKMTGSLQISNLQMEDSGFYRVQKVKGIKYEQIFYLSVKHPVPEPQVVQIHSAKRSCSLLCFVGNASEVNVSWIRDGKPLNTTELEISQEMQGGNVTYTCVASNPASNKSITVTPSHYCDEKGDAAEIQSHYFWIPVVVFIVINAVLIVVCCVKRCRASRDGSESTDSVSVNGGN